MKPVNVQSTNLWQRVVLSCSVLISTVVGGQLAALANAEAASNKDLSLLQVQSAPTPWVVSDVSTDTTMEPAAPAEMMPPSAEIDMLEAPAEFAESAVEPMVEPTAVEADVADPAVTEAELMQPEGVPADPAIVEEGTLDPGTAADLQPVGPFGVEPVSPDGTETQQRLQLIPPSPAPGSIAQAGADEVRYVFSYLGLGANIGITGDSAIGDTSFAVLSKIALNPYLSLRPGLLIEDDVTILAPITYDFGIAGPGEGSGIAPFAGLGLAISTGDDNAVDFLVTGGIDVPINDSLVAIASANIAPFGDEFDFGVLFGLGYTFASRSAVVAQPDVGAAVGGVADTLGRASRVNPSFLGAGINLGIGGDTALGNTSFALLSKIALGQTFSIRPGLLIEDEVTVLLPVTFDFEPIRTEYLTLAPYLGAGVAFSVGDDSEFDLLLSGGFDIPITSNLALTSGINFGVFDSFDVGATIGLVYTFSPF